MLLMLSFGCGKKQELLTRIRSNRTFNYIKVEKNFEIEVVEFYRNTASCTTEGGRPYALLIGITNDDLLPDTVSVLSICDNRIFNVGSNVTIEPIENPLLNTSWSPIYFVKDTIINDLKMRWVVGAEYPSVWGIPRK